MSNSKDCCGVYKRNEDLLIQKHVCEYFIASLVIRIQNWRQAIYLLTDEWIIKLCYIWTMEYYSTIKKLIQETTWVNIKHIMGFFMFFCKVYNLTVLLYSRSCVSITTITFRTFQYAPPQNTGTLQRSSPTKSPFPHSQGINFVFLQICLFWTFHINGVKQYMAFCYFFFCFFFF